MPRRRRAYNGVDAAEPDPEGGGLAGSQEDTEGGRLGGGGGEEGKGDFVDGRDESSLSKPRAWRRTSRVAPEEEDAGQEAEEWDREAGKLIALEHRQAHEPRVPKKDLPGYKDVAGDKFPLTIPPLSSTQPSMGDLGVGISLYFQTMRTFALLFLAMFLLGLPSLCLTFAANPEAVADGITQGGPMGALGALSVGGMYRVSNSSAYGCDANVCRFWDGSEVATTSVAYVMVWLDLTAAALFLWAVRHLSNLVPVVSEQIDGANITAADFSVMVTNVPKDLTEADLIACFAPYDGTMCPVEGAPLVIPGGRAAVGMMDPGGLEGVKMGAHAWMGALRDLYVGKEGQGKEEGADGGGGGGRRRRRKGAGGNEGGEVVAGEGFGRREVETVVVCGERFGQEGEGGAEQGLGGAGDPPVEVHGRRRRGRLPPLSETPRQLALSGDGSKAAEGTSKSRRRRKGPAATRAEGGSGGGDEGGGGNGGTPAVKDEAGQDGVKGGPGREVVMLPSFAEELPSCCDARPSLSEKGGGGEKEGPGKLDFKGVAKVWVCRKDGRLIGLLRQRGQAIAALELARSSGLQGSAKEAKLQQRLDQIEGDKGLQSLKPAEVVGAFVTFKTAEARDDCLRCYAKHAPPLLACCSVPPPADMMLGGGEGEGRACYPCVREAPEPSDVIYENLEVSSVSRLARRLVSNSISILAIVATFVIIMSAKSFQLALESTEKSCIDPRAVAACNARVPWNASVTVNGTNATLGDLWLVRHDAAHAQASSGANAALDNGFPLVVDTAIVPAHVRLVTNHSCRNQSLMMTAASDLREQCLASANPNEEQWRALISVAQLPVNQSAFPGLDCSKCVCAAMLAASPSLWSKALSWVGGEGYCDAQAGDSLGFIGMQAGAVVVVVTSNAVMGIVTRTMSAFERHSTQADLEVSVALSVCCGQFINTALVGLLVYARIDTVYSSVKQASGPAGEQVLARVPLFGGLFADISNRWYAVVGASILTTVIINIVLPLIPLAITLLGRMLLPLTSQFAKTQTTLNNMYLGQHFLLSTRYGSFLATVLVCYMYSAGMPILLLIGAAYFGVAYVVDQLTLLRFSRTPPAYSGSIATTTAKMFKYISVLHLLVGSWVFSATYPDGHLMYPRPPLGHLCEDLSKVACELAEGCAWKGEACDIAGIGGPITDRLFNSVTLPYTLAWLLVAALIVLGYTPLFPISRLFFGGAAGEAVVEAGDEESALGAITVPSWAEAVASERFGSFPSNYSILEQPAYETLLEIPGNRELYLEYSSHQEVGGA